MQRKNNFLNNKSTQRSGIALIMAVAVLVILSTIMALSLSLTAQTTKRTADLYLHEQAILVSKSAAELALLSIAKSTPCNVPSNELNYKFNLDGDSSTTADEIYDVNITLDFVYKGISCSDEYFEIDTDEQNGSVLMDITVTTNEGTEPIRYFRRSIQKL